MTTKRGVLVLQFGPVPQGYVGTSYPHRILDADPDDYRLLEYTDNLPNTLTKLLKTFQSDGKQAGIRYIMNLGVFAPLGSSSWDNTIPEDPYGHLWYVYYWKGRGACHTWNVDPLPPSILSSLIAEFRSSEGHISYASFGPTRSSEPRCIFVRHTQNDEEWQYQATGLPFLCERDSYKQIQGSAAKEGATEWVGGRLRGITFGPDNSYVVYRDNHYEWEGAFPTKLAEALREGKNKGWTINNCVLNPRNPNEYLLAFNKADNVLRVYCAVHKSFAPNFRKIINEWAEKKGFSGPEACLVYFKELEDDQCMHDIPPPNVARSSSRTRPTLPAGMTSWPSTKVLPPKQVPPFPSSPDSAVDLSRNSSQTSHPATTTQTIGSPDPFHNQLQMPYGFGPPLQPQYQHMPLYNVNPGLQQLMSHTELVRNPLQRGMQQGYSMYPSPMPTMQPDMSHTTQPYSSYPQSYYPGGSVEQPAGSRPTPKKGLIKRLSHALAGDEDDERVRRR